MYTISIEFHNYIELTLFLTAPIAYYNVPLSKMNYKPVIILNPKKKSL